MWGGVRPKLARPWRDPLAEEWDRPDLAPIRAAVPHTSSLVCTGAARDDVVGSLEP